MNEEYIENLNKQLVSAMKETKEKSKRPVLVPRITPRLLEESADNQAAWSKNFALSPSDTTDYTRQVVSSNILVLKALREQLKQKMTEREEREILLKAEKIQDETSTWLASIGRFKEAVKFAPAGKRKLYRAYLKAVTRGDDEWCQHPRWSDIDGNLQQNEYREFDFFSPEKGKNLSMMRCNLCGFRNARDLSADLQKLSEARARVIAISESVPKEQFEERLKKENLSGANLAQILRQ